MSADSSYPVGTLLKRGRKPAAPRARHTVDPDPPVLDRLSPPVSPVHSQVVHHELDSIDHRLCAVRTELLNLAELANQAITRQREYSGPRPSTK